MKITIDNYTLESDSSGTWTVVASLKNTKATAKRDTRSVTVGYYARLAQALAGVLNHALAQESTQVDAQGALSAIEVVGRRLRERVETAVGRPL